MILIADGGATKCDWAFVEGGEIVERVKMSGINPFSIPEERIRETLKREFMPTASRYNISHIWFYGSGCGFGGKTIHRVLAAFFPTTTIVVGSDLEGAAKACCPAGTGIVCILGTGAGSMQVERGVCTKRLPGLGYILGDEGSGAVMGRMLLADVFSNQLPPHLDKLFHEEYDVTIDEVLDQTYHKPAPNRFFGRFTPFLSKHIDEEYCQNFVRQSFDLFVKRNLLQYDINHLAVSFVGSIASVFEKQLVEVLNEYGIHKGIIVPSPIDNLVKNLTAELISNK